MLSENIKNYRKKNNLSQDELAEKLCVSRQSISLWETGQTQPTIDNIIALTKIFNISSDMLLGNSSNIEIPQDNTPEEIAPATKRKAGWIPAVMIAIAVIVGAILFVVFSNGRESEKNPPEKESANSSAVQPENSPADSSPNRSPGSTSSETTPKPSEPAETDNKEPDNNNANAAVPAGPSEPSGAGGEIGAPVDEEFDLFSYCKNFAIQTGTLNGDYCIYQQPASKYGGYDNEYVSIAYWADSDMVEFCLHCPLSETQSHNFYLRMRGGYNGIYEYVSSKYFRDTGESLRIASGYIDPTVFSDSYPISCDEYQGSADGQTEFMEESRVGICDLIRCLKEFVTIEGMECDFSDFGFVNF